MHFLRIHSRCGPLNSGCIAREQLHYLVRRYPRFSIEVGRLPSILGRELFRSKVTSYRMSSFEDAVIFVYDVERALAQLNAFGQLLIGTITFQEFTQDAPAEHLRCARRTSCREFSEALDRISELFLQGGLLNRLPCPPVENSCQGGPEAHFQLSDCKTRRITVCKVWHKFICIRRL